MTTGQRSIRGVVVAALPGVLGLVLTFVNQIPASRPLPSPVREILAFFLLAGLLSPILTPAATYMLAKRWRSLSTGQRAAGVLLCLLSWAAVVLMLVMFSSIEDLSM